MENQYNLKIKRLRSDSGGEYVSREFDSMLLKIGIKRELSCAHTPQQNGVSERKNRHLVESCGHATGQGSSADLLGRMH